MQIRFVLGPAGSGKTFRCLTEVRAELATRPDGPALLFLAPKQATFQLERQLLADPALPGFARLHILSFERLAHHVLDAAEPELLSEEGRVMVLRALLTKHLERLQVFHASARMPSFARELSDALRELRRSQTGPARLAELAGNPGVSRTLAAKLRDLALLDEAYRTWLDERGLADADGLIDQAIAALLNTPATANPLRFARVWLDGFAEMTPPEVALLKAVVTRCESATLAFCLEETPAGTVSWLSAWGVIGETFQRCHAALAETPGAQVATEILGRRTEVSRFGGNAELGHLEANWAHPRPMAWAGRDEGDQQTFDFRGANQPKAVQLVSCPHPDDEAGAAADQVLGYVQQGGRFRDVAVLARGLEQVPGVFCRVFRRRGIPFFLDQRQPVGHHPLTELTRAALRMVAFGWRHEDWFGALKTGLAGLEETAADRLENLALAEGIEGAQWRRVIPGNGKAAWAEEVRSRVVAPFLELEAQLREPVTGPILAGCLYRLWDQLNLEDQLAGWDREAVATGGPTPHGAALESLRRCFADLERAFPDIALPPAEWLSILESAFGGLTVGLVPPALDQVLIGAIDRSRNPNLEFVILPGWNEGQFPLVTDGSSLLSAPDREMLAQHGLPLGLSPKVRLGHERFYAYIALTRARRRVIVTFARSDAAGGPLNPSPFVGRLRRLFPERAVESRTGAESRDRARTDARRATGPDPFGSEFLSPAVAACLHGPILEVSVTAMEKFADCPFRFFVETGLRGRERQHFEFEAREQGTLQHELLARFHRHLRTEGKQWRDLSPAEARRRMEAVADAVEHEHRHGLIASRGENELRFRGIRRRLGDFVAATVGWMAGNQFDPAYVELEFGSGDAAALPAWRTELGPNRTLSLRGKIDRIDLWRDPATSACWALLVDYKSSEQKFEPALTLRGATIQLPAYLAALGQLGLPRDAAVPSVQPAGMVFAALREAAPRAKARPTVPESAATAAGHAFPHRGRLNRQLRDQLERLPDGSPTGQFKLGKPKKDGVWTKTGDSFPPEELRELLHQVTATLRSNANRILDGAVSAEPLRLGPHDACNHCASQAICRIAAVTI